MSMDATTNAPLSLTGTSKASKVHKWWKRPRAGELPKEWVCSYTIRGPGGKTVSAHLGCDVDYGKTPVYWAFVERDDYPGVEGEPVPFVVTLEAVNEAYQAALASKEISPGLVGMRTVLIGIWDGLPTDGEAQGLPTWMTGQKDGMKRKLTEALHDCEKAQKAIDARAALMGCPQP
jgi:hypothetical protein